MKWNIHFVHMHEEMKKKQLKIVNRDKSLHVLDSQVQHALSRTSAQLDFNNTNNKNLTSKGLSKGKIHIRNEMRKKPIAFE